MKIGVLFCTCGGQISEHIDIDRLKKSILKKEDVLWFEIIDLACAEEGRGHLIEHIKKYHVDGLIILGCTPTLKGQYLLDVFKDAGISPYMVNFVNIREQVIWVTPDKTQALNKIYTLFMGALYRLRHQVPLQEREIPVCTDIMVVGGGIAGLTASITLSKMGKKVYLIEKERFLGGRISAYETLFPNLECAPCIIHPVIDEVLNDQKIELITNSEVFDIRGGFGNLFVKILQGPNYINPKRCIGCFACVEVCQEGCIEINPRRLPTIANIDESRCRRLRGEDCHACIEACPVTDTIDLDAIKKEIDVKVGAIFWATGFNLFDCMGLTKLGYGVLTNVYTSSEFEDLVHPEGHTKGKIITKEGREPNNVCIIHCVGSLDDDFYNHCSKICCQYAFKFNRLIRQKMPNVIITHLIKELVLPGIRANNLYLQARDDQKVQLLRYGSIKDIEIERQDNRLLVKFSGDTIPSDMVILCPAILQGNVFQGDNRGFILTGSVKEPMSFDETKTDALAQVSNLTVSLKDGDKVKKSLHFAKFDYNKCTKCGICMAQCPYNAIEIKQGHTVDITDALCEGCGICVVSCPSKAIDLEGFTYKQIMSEIQGLIDTQKEDVNWQ
ncbi:MAG: 4Fe-4S binding protein [Thermodesulfovibrionales bacterium]